ncbi:acyl-CoA carboxylase subunit epsilon [Streptosporangium sp. 'caverna']|uniref:acyl-CoA carboxylase subunit epsilon n=1 Tax=Streptosporangium sp. 'caverna' TaxID=2202249 RepID=UPI000D7D6B30|nr:acyl-CoA carboxylase subunit epsilon [Streptosporangium sp. 'caverna']AWS44273.1 acetyl-CoA carboxylase biotin carboxyl carrier protein subunit [Streptosporangium sp. 'caverna']
MNPLLPEPSTIQIVRGNPDPHELAALTVVLATVLATGFPEDDDPPATVASRWAAPFLSAPALSWAARPHPAWRPLF